MRFIPFFGLVIALVLCSCTTKKKIIEQKSQSSLYNPGSSYLHPEYIVFHQSEDISQLILRINTDELLFNQANSENKLLANITVQYQLIDITDNPFSKDIADSATTVKKMEKMPGRNIILLTFLLKAKYGKQYSLKIVLSDNLRNIKQQNYVSVNKLSKFSGQNFKVISRLNDLPIFRNFVVPDETVRILSGQPEVKRYFIKYRKDDTPLPPPPFSVQMEPGFKFKEDSMWIFNYNQQQSFLFPYKGMYLIQSDSAQADGLLLTNPGPGFPKVNEPDLMIPPLEYLTTTDEFNSLKKDDNKKLTIDNFWLKMGGNVDMARELIRIYYNRMYYSNVFFTSYKPGWKTDRGMIYLIFGPPTLVSKNASSETWEYYIKQDASNLALTFDKVPSPYSENNYVMLRNDSYTRFWRTAIETWRKGKAYSLEE